MGLGLIMDDLIQISWLNDFVFCPISLYIHRLYGQADHMLLQNPSQINGSHAHAAVDTHRYSGRADILQGMTVYCEQYGLIGKIDLFDQKKHLLIERKKKLKKIFLGHHFQLYGQYFALKEMGYNIKAICLYSMDDNKTYPISLPEKDPDCFVAFEKTISQMRAFNIFSFVQTNKQKCLNCIYEPLCGGSVVYDE